MNASDPFALPIWRVDKLRDPQGRVVMHLVMVRGERPANVPEFCGIYNLQFCDAQGNTVRTVEREFRIDSAKTIEEAFAAFNNLRDQDRDAVQQKQHEAEEKAATKARLQLLMGDQGAALLDAEKARAFLDSVKKGGR